MNLLSSHDIVRLRTALAVDADYRSMSREQQLAIEFTQEALDTAIVKEKLCAAIQYAVPGMPSLYYGDEQGMYGVSDPFNRAFFTESDCGLYEWYADLAAFRNENSAMSTGEAEFMAPSGDILAVLRWNHNDRDAFGHPAPRNACLCVINRSDKDSCFECDCSSAGIGLYNGWIAARDASFIKLL